MSSIEVLKEIKRALITKCEIELSVVKLLKKPPFESELHSDLGYTHEIIQQAVSRISAIDSLILILNEKNNERD